MRAAYRGPLRDEPVAVELHNTLYAAGGEVLDGLATRASAEAWLAGLAGRIAGGGKGGAPQLSELVDLRAAVRQALHSIIDGGVPTRASLGAINRYSTRAPRSRVARWRTDGRPTPEWDHGGATRADIVLSALAADAIELLSGPDLANLRACDAPGCVLLFVKGHGRREWCSGQCGNRARQARHYRRTHGSAAGRTDR